MCPLFLPSLMQILAGPVHAASGSEFMWALFSSFWRPCSPWCPPSPPTLPVSLPPHLQGSLSHEGMDLMDTYHLVISLKFLFFLYVFFSSWCPPHKSNLQIQIYLSIFLLIENVYYNSFIYIIFSIVWHLQRLFY